METNLRLFKLLRFHISSQLTSQAAVCGPVFGPDIGPIFGAAELSLFGKVVSKSAVPSGARWL